MRSSPFLYFFTLQFFREYKNHLATTVISIALIFLLSAVLFISSSIKYSIDISLGAQADFVVERVRGGKKVDLPIEWIDTLLETRGVQKVTTRVHGRYFFEDKREWALIVGIDFMDEQSNRALEKLVESVDLEKFLFSSNMLVGDGVQRYLKEHFYPKGYNFLTPDGKYKKVSIFGTIPNSLNLMSNNMIIMPQELAKEILGIKKSMVTDLTLNVPNDNLWDSISDKIASLYYDIRVLTKREMQKAYENMYNYKSGVFLMLFLITMATFVLILYQRYSMVFSSQRRNIGLLRAVGWSIRDILKLKLYESLMVVLVSYVIGVSLAYLYVFVFDSPVLIDMFLGGENLDHKIKLIPVVDFGVLSSIFLIYTVAFIASVLIPTWSIAVTDPKEAML
ncbi:MAG: FtsX-like permease family protein [Sulfurovum sp.]|nr:FtsX-like permease family protein [Sulfurovum sp.]